MHRRISTILNALRQDLAARLGDDVIGAACRAAGHTWCDSCLLTPAAIIHWFLIQSPPRQHRLDPRLAPGRPRLLRIRLLPGPLPAPPGRLPRPAPRHGPRMIPDTEAIGRWRGHRTFLVDGSSFSMPDTPELQAHFGQPGNQAKGCGFPMAHLLAFFHSGTGLLLEVIAAPLRSSDLSGIGAILSLLAAGDVVVADRGFCSFAHLAMLDVRGVHAVFRLHQKQIVDFTPGRAHAEPGRKRGVKGMPRSRWIPAWGMTDQVVEYFKPADRPAWMSEDDYRSLASSIEVRELRYRIEVPGFRTREVTLVTTLLDADGLPGRFAGGIICDEVACGGESEVAQDDDEDGCVEVHDGGWCAQGVDDVRDGVQPGAGGDVRGGRPSGGGGGSGELHRRTAVAARCRGGGGDAGVGGQSVCVPGGRSRG